MSQQTNTPAKPTRVAVGMSGGLDSSVVAALMVDAGYDVIGLTLHMFKEGSRCCSLHDVERARTICTQLGIRHYTVNAVDQFADVVIKPFIEEYANGRTPSPCVLCNEFIKFGTLHERALELGCSHVATGHYVRLAHSDGRWHLLKARDATKDQSYFLHRLSQKQLGRSLFPLESWKKTETAKYAEEKKLPVSTSSKEESQDLCFVTNDGHAPFIESYKPNLRKQGDVVDEEGHVLGCHEGFHRYTVGQRKGLGIAAADRLYVKELDPKLNKVVLSKREAVQRESCLVEDPFWISGQAPEEGSTFRAHIRYRHEGVPARLAYRANGNVELAFEKPQFAVAPGQAAVLYDGDEVIGGGWIATETATWKV